MPVLPTQSFNQMVTNTISGIQGRAAKLINFSTGSTLRAITEGFAGLFLWFQALVLQLLTAIRLSTSSGTDVDTFTADFMPIVTGSITTALPGGSPRLGAQFASGTVTYTRFTDRKSTRLNSSHQIISYAVFCLKKKKLYLKYNYTTMTIYDSNY